MKKMKTIMKAVLLVAGLALCERSHAVIVFNTNYDTSSIDAPQGIINNDLINNGQSSLSGVTYSVAGADYGDFLNLNDGSAGAAAANAGVAIKDGVYTATFDLDITSNTLGYTINSISTLTGYSDLRIRQNFTIEYSLVGSSLYNFLGSSFDSGTTGTTNQTLKLTVFDDASSDLLAGVDSIRFTFNLVPYPPFGNVGSAYREIDVIGAATVPEPSTYAMLGLAGLLLFVLRRAQSV
jgi:hypothetical protein